MRTPPLRTIRHQGACAHYTGPLLACRASGRAVRVQIRGDEFAGWRGAWGLGYCVEVMDVQTASRDELLAYIATLEAAVAALESRVRELEGRTGEGAPRRMPGHKPEQRAESPVR